MRTTQVEYEPVWDFTNDYGIYINHRHYSYIDGDLSNISLGDFTLFCIEAGWESGYFTFHLALLGFHIGRSLQIKY